MKNLIIYGSGRSGTSMLAGLFSEVGYHMGESLYPPRDTNPKGFFESNEINSLNERILRYNFPAKFKSKFSRRAEYNLGLTQGQLWLADMNSSLIIKSNNQLDNEIKNQIEKKPFCYKDPRFCYTYPVWRKHLGEHCGLIIFRHPSQTIQSIIKQIHANDYLKNYSVDIKRLNSLWRSLYTQALKYNDRHILLSYDQVFDPTFLNLLEERIGVSVNRSFGDASLNRTSIDESFADEQSLALYKELINARTYKY